MSPRPTPSAPTGASPSCWSTAERALRQREGRLTIKNRWFLLLAGILSFALVLGAACGGDDDDEGGGTTPAPTTADGGKAPPDQQKITIQSAEPQYYDPHRSSFEQDIGIERMIFRGLYNLTDDGKGGAEVAPGLAAGEPTINGSVYTVKLKSGLKWSDGQALTAQHFVDGAKRGCDPQVAVDYGYLWGEGYLDLVGCSAAQANEDPTQKQALLDAIGARAVDDTTVEFTLTKPNGRFTTIMAIWVTFPARLDVVNQYGDRWTDPANIVTNGPFTISALTPGDSVTLTPNPNWSGDEPSLQEIKIKFLDDLSAAFRSYQSGELDLTTISASDVTVAKGDPDLKDDVVIDPTARIETLQFNNSRAPLDNEKLRIALGRSVDREALNEAVYDGASTPALYWVVKGINGHQGNEPFEDVIGYDPDAARQALADSGLTNIRTLGVIVNTPARIAVAEYLQQAFEPLGITLDIQQVDGRTRAARYNSGDYDIVIGGWQLDYPDIENPLFGLFETGGGNNQTFCSQPDVDAALERALAATSEEARIKAYQDMEDGVIAHACVAPMYQASLSFLVSEKLGGIVPNGVIDAGMPGNYAVESWFVKAQ